MKTKVTQFLKVWIWCLALCLLISCTDRERPVEKSKLLGNDYRLFQGTQAWELAKAVWDEDVAAIKRIITETEVGVDFQEPRFGNTLLMLAVQNQQYTSAKALLELGADPNKPDNYDGSSAIIDAVGTNSFFGDDTKYIKLLLKYGADPNSEEVGERRPGSTVRSTPLLEASGRSLEKVRILVEAGANINYSNEFGVTPLSRAYLLGNYEIVLFLLKQGADYKTPIIEREGKKLFLADMLREKMYAIDSKEHKQKMAVVAFLEQKGVEYRKLPITAFVVERAKQKYPKAWQHYLDNY
jgi:uncharacterized protein